MQHARKIVVGGNIPLFVKPNLSGHDISPTEKYVKPKPIDSKPKTDKSKVSKSRFKTAKVPKTKTVKPIVVRPVILSPLDSKIKKILRMKEDDRTKWTLYQQVLHESLFKPKKDVLEHLNDKYKAQAIQLLDTLKGNVTWTDTGTVSVHGKEIPYSHIVDLIEAYFNPSKAKPPGWESFKSVLPVKVVEEKGIQWEPWPPKRSPKPRKSKKN